MRAGEVWEFGNNGNPGIVTRFGLVFIQRGNTRPEYSWAKRDRCNTYEPKKLISHTWRPWFRERYPNISVEAVVKLVNDDKDYLFDE